jgi:mRNA-degrading endonuclease toxin of MazEF toxin-antitoxin module
MAGPHYGLVLSADLFNQATGFVVIAPITSKGGKLSGFELPINAGRVSGVVVLSGLRSLDYQVRDVQFECKAPPDLTFEANRRVKMVFPTQ